jgi:uncharacterized protein YceK
LKEKSMKLNFERWAVVVLMSVLMTGCSSIRSRTENANKEWKLYPGVRLDVKDSVGLLSGKNTDPDWIKGVMAAIYSADLPFSALFDTLVAPYDLYRIYNPKHSEAAMESSK